MYCISFLKRGYYFYFIDEEFRVQEFSQLGLELGVFGCGEYVLVIVCVIFQGYWRLRLCVCVQRRLVICCVRRILGRLFYFCFYYISIDWFVCCQLNSFVKFLFNYLVGVECFVFLFRQIIYLSGWRVVFRNLLIVFIFNGMSMSGRQEFYLWGCVEVGTWKMLEYGEGGWG